MISAACTPAMKASARELPPGHDKPPAPSGATDQGRKAVSKRDNNAAWTAPGPVGATDRDYGYKDKGDHKDRDKDKDKADDQYKGTAAAHPVLVVVPQHPAPRTPEQIEAELDRTRADLERTLDELSVQLSPRNLVRRAGKGARARLVDPESGKPRRAALASAGGAVAVAGGAIVVVRALKRHRR